MNIQVVACVLVGRHVAAPDVVEDIAAVPADHRDNPFQVVEAVAVVACHPVP